LNSSQLKTLILEATGDKNLAEAEALSMDVAILRAKAEADVDRKE
jgi:hypothetical protein